jgi:hypothetical protein
MCEAIDTDVRLISGGPDKRTTLQALNCDYGNPNAERNKERTEDYTKRDAACLRY